MADPKSPYNSLAPDANDRVLASGAASLLSQRYVDEHPGSTSSGAFNVYRYPSNIGSDEYPHYVMFFITVRESDVSDSEKKSKQNMLKFDYSKNNSGVDKSEASAQGFELVASLAGGAKTGSAAAKGLGFGKGGQDILGVFGAGMFEDILRNSGVAKQKDQVLLKDAIALYMTGKPSVQYQANWEDQDIGIVGGLSKNLSQMGSVKDIFNDVDNLKRTIGGGMASYVLSQSIKQGDFGGLGNAGAAFSAAAGVTPNPFKAQLFKSMGFRKFSYDYVFLPKNPTEYKEVQNIIYTFKRYMHPTLGAGKFILNYPAEFTIAYFHKDDRNKELYKISNCALTNLSIEYGGTDFTTFKGTRGAPTEIAMKLEFTELEVLSRERIEAGY
jgi:hypothetical protein